MAFSPVEVPSGNILAGIQALWDDITQQAQQAARSASELISNHAQQLSSKPHVQKPLAKLRWGTFGASTTVPLPSQPDDPRLLLSVANLAKVLLDEFYHFRSQQQLRDAGLGAGTDEYDSGPLRSGAAGIEAAVPPVTLALAAAAAWRYFTPVLLREVCLSPYCIVERKEYYRLLSAPLVHLDATHALTNVAALLPEAILLERRRGSMAFALDLVALAVMSGGLFVGWGVLEKDVLHKPSTYYAVGAIGLSSVGFGLQVVAGEARRGTQMEFLGIPVPAQYAWALQLALTHAFTPEASFAGHMCGVLAGLAHVYVLQPALRWLCGGEGAAPRPRVYGSGTTGGRRLGAGAGGGPARGQQLRRAVRSAALQLGLAAGGVLLYALASRKRVRQPMSSWGFT